MTARETLTLVAAVTAIAILAGCSGTSSGTSADQRPRGSTVASTPATSSLTPSPATTTPSQPAPRATESNPPGDIPDNQAYVPFSPVGGGYSVKIPEGWSRTTKEATTSFSDKLNHIQISTAGARSEPSLTSVTNTDTRSVKATVPNFAMGKVSSVVRNGGKAILLTYQGDSAPDQVTGKVVRDAFERYTFYRAGKRVDLTLSGPTNADNVDPWRIVSDSLRWK